MAPEENDSKYILDLVSCLQDEEGMEESELVEKPSRPLIKLAMSVGV